ncbi:uncharacterized protein FPRN_15154 [Fusarium proliferatum]|nr:uncharacterized protein FPRN_15154 [Fusarium proliferatum]
MSTATERLAVDAGGTRSGFDIHLLPHSEHEGNLRTENYPAGQLQREDIVRRQGLVNVSCILKDVAHGYYSDTNDDKLATIIILSSRFESLYNRHRIKRVEMSLTFSAKESGGSDPVVLAIAPDGFFSVQPTSQPETLNTTVGGTAGAGVFGVEVSANLQQERTVQREIIDMTKVQGIIHTTGRNHGRPNTAQWILRENGAAETGVPTSMQAAILLERSDMSEFQAHCAMTITTDWLASAFSVFKSDPKDDPVFFHPDCKATSKLKVYNTDNLGGENLAALSRVTVTTVLNDTNRVENQQY